MEEQEKLNHIIISHPCKTCLKRPVCDKECDDLENHYDTMFIALFIVSIIIITIAWWSIFYHIWSYKILVFLMGIILCIGYKEIIKDIINDRDFKDYTNKEKAFILFIGPYGLAVSWVFNRIDIETYMDKHITKRFNKKL